MLYGFPDVGRSGLANMLLPWARCEVFCRENRIPMLAAQWTQPKIGPLLRQEKDKRFYIGLFKNEGYVGGLKRWLLLARAARIGEAEAARRNGALQSETANKNLVIVFSGLGRYFADLEGEEDFLHRRLEEILSDSCRGRLTESSVQPFVAIHIRRGDKPPLPAGVEPPKGTMHWAISINWYMRCLQQVREILKKEIPAIVFTDARTTEIQPILDLPNVRLAESNPAIVDMLLMAKARVLVTTASSTFSMWSSFLGRMPSVWFPSDWREKTNWANPEFECYTDLSGNLPGDFTKILQAHSAY